MTPRSVSGSPPGTIIANPPLAGPPAEAPVVSETAPVSATVVGLSEPASTVVLASLEGRSGEGSAEEPIGAARTRFREQIVEARRLLDSGTAEEIRRGHELMTSLTELALRVETNPEGDRATLTRDLILLRGFYRSTLASDRLNSVESQLRTLRDTILQPHLTLSPGTRPTAEQLSDARLACEISRELGHYSRLSRDLDTWQGLIRAADATVLPDSERSQAIIEVMQGWVTVLHEISARAADPYHDGVPITETAVEVRDRLRGLREDFLRALPGLEGHPELRAAIQRQITQAIEFNDPAAEAWLDIDTLVENAPAWVEAETHLSDALGIASPVERRAALLEVLHEAVELHSQSICERTINALSLTLSTDLSPEERLLLLTNEASLLHGSGLSFEATVDHEARTLIDQLLNHYADDPVPHARDLLAAQTYCQLTGATEYSERLVDALQATGDRMANALHFDDGLTDHRDRIAMASLLVEIDQATLHSDVGSLASDPEDLQRGNARLIGDRLLARIDMLQAEIDAAPELPLEERFTNLRSLASALAEYDSLTEGRHPMIASSDLARRSDTAEAALQLVLEEIFAPPADASQEQLDATRAVLYDVRTRIHFAIGNGEPNFLQSLDGAALRLIAERSQEAHCLMVPLGDPPTPEAIESRMGAAAIFAEIGLTNRVNEALNPIRIYARSVSDINQRFEFLRSLVQIAQSTGMSVEANAMLGDIAELAGHDGASEELHQFAETVPALQALNDGDLGRAEDLLTSLPDNPLAVEMLPRVREGVAQIRDSRMEMIWRAAFSDYVQRHAEQGGADPEGTERSLNQALDRALALVRSGECPSLIAGLERCHSEGNAAIGNFLFEEAAHARILSGLSEPGLTLAEFQDRILESARVAEHEERFNLARQLAGLVRDDPRLAAEANELLDGMGVSETVAGLLSPSTLCTIPTPWTIIPGILLSTSDHEVLNALENTAITVATLGVARWGAMGAEAAFLSSRSAAALSPILRRVAGWGVRSASEAAIFTGIGMAHGALASGSMEGLTIENFGRQFGAMLVIFAVCHGVGMGTGALGRAAESVPSLRATGAVAERLTAAGLPQLNAAGRALIGTTGYVSTISGLVGAEYFNEAIGLSESESDLPWYVRFANAAIMDAQMRAGGHLVNGLTGGAIERLERMNGRRYEALDLAHSTGRLSAAVERLGFDPNSPDGQMLVMQLLARVAGGSSLREVEASLGAVRASDTSRILRMVLDVPPESPRGRRLSALLVLYRQANPNGDLAEIAGRLGLEINQLLRNAGISEGTARAELREELLERVLASRLTPDAIANLARVCAARRSVLLRIVEGRLGAGGAESNAGQTMLARLLLFSLENGRAPRGSEEITAALGETAAPLPAESRSESRESPYGERDLDRVQSMVLDVPLDSANGVALRSALSSYLARHGGEGFAERVGGIAAEVNVFLRNSGMDIRLRAQVLETVFRQGMSLEQARDFLRSAETHSRDLEPAYAGLLALGSDIPIGRDAPPHVIAALRNALMERFLTRGSEAATREALLRALIGGELRITRDGNGRLHFREVPEAERPREMANGFDRLLRRFGLTDELGVLRVTALRDLIGRIAVEGGEAGTLSAVQDLLASLPATFPENFPSGFREDLFRRICSGEITNLESAQARIAALLAGEAPAVETIEAPRADVALPPPGEAESVVVPRPAAVPDVAAIEAARHAELVAEETGIALIREMATLLANFPSGDPAVRQRMAEFAARVEADLQGALHGMERSASARARLAPALRFYQEYVLNPERMSELFVEQLLGIYNDAAMARPVVSEADREARTAPRLRMRTPEVLAEAARAEDGESETPLTVETLSEAAFVLRESAERPGHRTRTVGLTVRSEASTREGHRRFVIYQGRSRVADVDLPSGIERETGMTILQAAADAVRERQGTDRRFRAIEDLPEELRADARAALEAFRQRLNGSHLEIPEGAILLLTEDGDVFLDRPRTGEARLEMAYVEAPAESGASPEIARLLREIENTATLVDPLPGSPAYEITQDVRTLARQTRARLATLEPGSEDYALELTAYRSLRDSLLQSYVDGFEGARTEVLDFLDHVPSDSATWEAVRGAHPDLIRPRIATDIAPHGRPKAASDVLAKAERRGSHSLETITDIAGTRIVVEGYEDVTGLVAMIRQHFEFREMRDENGRVVVDDGSVAFDHDTIRRTITGGGTGYRGLHVVVVADGRPVEIQIQTRAMYEWGILQHSLLYKNADLPAGLREAVNTYCSAAARHLSDIEIGAAPAEPPSFAAVLEAIPESYSEADRAELIADLEALHDLTENFANRPAAERGPIRRAPRSAPRPETPAIAAGESPEMVSLDSASRETLTILARRLVAAHELAHRAGDAAYSEANDTPLVRQAREFLRAAEAGEETPIEPGFETSVSEAIDALAAEEPDGSAPPPHSALALPALGLGLGGGADPIFDAVSGMAHHLSPALGNVVDQLPHGALPTLCLGLGMVAGVFFARRGGGETAPAERGMIGRFFDRIFGRSPSGTAAPAPAPSYPEPSLNLVAAESDAGDHLWIRRTDGTLDGAPAELDLSRAGAERDGGRVLPRDAAGQIILPIIVRSLTGEGRPETVRLDPSQAERMGIHILPDGSAVLRRPGDIFCVRERYRSSHAEISGEHEIPEAIPATADGRADRAEALADAFFGSAESLAADPVASHQRTQFLQRLLLQYLQSRTRGLSETESHRLWVEEAESLGELAEVYRDSRSERWRGPVAELARTMVDGAMPGTPAFTAALELWSVNRGRIASETADLEAQELTTAADRWREELAALFPQNVRFDASPIGGEELATRLLADHPEPLGTLRIIVAEGDAVSFNLTREILRQHGGRELTAGESIAEWSVTIGGRLVRLRVERVGNPGERIRVRSPLLSDPPPPPEVLPEAASLDPEIAPAIDEPAPLELDLSEFEPASDEAPPTVLHSVPIGLLGGAGLTGIGDAISHLAHSISPSLGHLVDQAPHGSFPVLVAGLGIAFGMFWSSRPASGRVSAETPAAPPPLPEGAFPLRFRSTGGEDVIVIGRGGRDVAVDIALPERTVSRRHAILRRGADGSLSLQGLGGENGTWIYNGHSWIEVTAATPIQPGTVFAFGRPAGIREATLEGGRTVRYASGPGDALLYRVSVDGRALEPAGANDLIDMPAPPPPVAAPLPEGAFPLTFRASGSEELIVIGRGGRETPVDIALPDRTISRRHAILRRGTDGGFTLQGVGGENGTWVYNGHSWIEVTDPVSVPAGAVIGFGRPAGIREATLADGRTVRYATAPGDALLFRISADGRALEPAAENEMVDMSAPIPAELAPLEIPATRPRVVIGRIIPVGEAPSEVAVEEAAPYDSRPWSSELDPHRLPVGRWVSFRFFPDGTAGAALPGTPEGLAHSMMRDANGRIHFRAGSSGGGRLYTVDTTLTLPDESGLARHPLNFVEPGQEVILGEAGVGFQIGVGIGSAESETMRFVDVPSRPELPPLPAGTVVEADVLPLAAHRGSPEVEAPVVVLGRGSSESPYTVTSSEERGVVTYTLTLSDLAASPDLPRLIHAVLRPGEVLNPETFRLRIPMPGTLMTHIDGVVSEFIWRNTAEVWDAARTREALGADLRSLAEPPLPPLAERLTNLPTAVRESLRNLEDRFELGDTIGESYSEPGAFVRLERRSGANTMSFLRASESDYLAYRAWLEHRPTFPERSPADRDAWRELRRFARGHGIRVTAGNDLESVDEVPGGISGNRARYILETLRLLPESFLASGYLQAIHIGTSRRGAYVGAAMGSAFENREVYLYSGALEGTRDLFLGYLLHEMGHSTAERYHAEDGDARIPLEVRTRMERDFNIVAAARRGFGLDWAHGIESRLAYTGESYDEFLAEMNLHYVAAGPRLREYIRSIPEPQVRDAYQRIYDEIRDRVFSGREY